jgi:hypothetical protein
MKTTKFITMALLLAAASAGMSSCSVSDNEKSPEQVEDPIKDAVEYYIVGKVTANNSALSGVTVSTSGLDAVTTDANGQFTLTVEEQKEYTLEFAKDGYLKASTIVKLSGLSNRSSVAVSVQMTQKAAEEDIPANQNVLVEANSTNHTTEVSNAANADAVANIATVGAYIPKETIEAGTKISMTQYVPEVTSTQVAQNSSAPVMAVYVETIGEDITATTANPVVLSVKNPTTDGTHFESMEVYADATSRASANLGTANYNAATQSYDLELTFGTLSGSYEFRVSYTRTATAKTSVIKEGKVDNSGNFEAKKDVTIAYSAQMGWTYTAAPTGGLTNLMKNAIASQEGTEGTYTMNYEEVTNVSGNSIMYWKAENKYNEVTYTFTLNNGTATAKLKKYTGVAFTYTNETANQHSGGTSSTGNAQ